MSKQTDHVMRQLLYRPCKTKQELKNWLKIFLKLDLPDTTIDPDSNSNPLDMVWNLYRTAVWYDDINASDRTIRSIYYASRGSFKSLCASAAELIIMLHTGRETIHLAATIAQAANAYNKYFRMFLQKPYLQELVISSILSQTTIKDKDGREISLKIIPCTIQATSGPRANLIAMDEIDKIRGDQMAAYHNVHGMLTTTPNKQLPIVFGISTRDSVAGLIQKEIDESDKTGTKIYHWNIIDITEQCPEERSGIEKINIYAKKDSLVCIPESAYMNLSGTEKLNYEKAEGYKGCLDNCRIFSACKCSLKNQKSKCKWLKTIESTQEVITKATSEDFVFTQLLCKKPPTSGLVYPDFEYAKNVRTASEMYEIYTGEKPEHELEIDDLIAIFDEHKVDRYIGVDAGFHNAAAILIFIDNQGRVYIVKEYTPVDTDSSELATWLYDHWKKYSPNLVFVDPESPDCSRLIRKKGFSVSSRVDKDRKAGVNTVKGCVRIPMTDKTRLLVHSDCIGVRQEMSLYKYRKNMSGQYLDEPEKLHDHVLDAIRYVLHTLFGKSGGNLAYDKDIPMEPKNNVVFKLPLGPDVGSIIGERIVDNRNIIKNKEEPEKGKSMIKFDFFDDGDLQKK